MNRLGTGLAIGVAGVALALMMPTARATDTGCRKWEVKLFPMKAEHESAMRAGRIAGPLAVEEGWEPFGMAYTPRWRGGGACSEGAARYAPRRADAWNHVLAAWHAVLAPDGESPMVSTCVSSRQRWSTARS